MLTKPIKQLPQTVENVISSNLFLKLTILWFLIQCIFFAMTTKYGLPPDETYHYTYIKLFAEHSPSPILYDQGNYHVLLEAVKHPFFLYHFLLGFPFLVIRNLPSAYIILRLINVVFGLLSLYFVYLVSNQLKISKLARNLTIFMLSNTLMFVFIFSAVSYDTMFILISMVGVYLLLRLQQKISANQLLLFVAVVFTGIFVKINFLPMAAILMTLFFVKYFKKLPKVAVDFKKKFSINQKLNILLIIVIGFLSILFVQRYVGNVLNYGKIVPDCDQVQTINYCMKNSIFRRIQSIASLEKQEAGVSTISYIIIWSKLMTQRTFGIFAHHIRFPAINLIVGWVIFMFFIGVAFLAKLWKRKDSGITTVAVITIFYLIALIAQNYFQTYKTSFNIELAVHGRYAFGVLPFIFLLITEYTLRGLRSSLLRFLYISITIVIFIVAGFPTYIIKSEDTWFNRGTNKIMQINNL